MRSVRAVFLLSCVVLALVAMSSRASAQGLPKFFADGVGYLGIDQFDHSADGAFDGEINPSGTVGGGTVGVGTFLTSNVSVRFEASFESGISGDVPYLPYIAAYGALYQVPSGELVPLLVPNFRHEQHKRTFAALAAYHRGEGRVRMAYLAGLAILRTEDRTTVDRSFLPLVPGGIVARDESRYVSYTNAPILGVDVQIEVAKHLALLPQVRALALDGLVSIRPGIGLRWIP